MRGETIILAAGDFPRRDGAAWKLLVGAKRVVACDSAAAAYRRRFRKWPDVVVGDFDSLVLSAECVVQSARCLVQSAQCVVQSAGDYCASHIPLTALSTKHQALSTISPALSTKHQALSTEFIHSPDQETNDLEKALIYCARRGWKHPVVVGATGKREDHTLGNIFRALDYGVEIVTDYGRFVPVGGRASFAVKKGAPVSIFATDPKTRMTSKGLEWALNGVRFCNLYCATLNRATATRVILTTTKPVSVYLAERN